MLTGIVEGFYGKPFSVVQRGVLMHYLSYLDKPVYLYAPKNDPYHRIRWREKYPSSKWNDIESGIESAAKNGVQFFFGISPYGFEDDESGILASKIQRTVDAGVSGIAVLYDDIPENADAELARRQIEFTGRSLAGVDLPIMLCPVIYCEEFITRLNGSEYLKVWREELPPEWNILWTGSTVISKSLSTQDTARSVELLGREPVIWDNLHANDYCMRRIFLGKLDERLSGSAGYLLNPSECFSVALHSVFRLVSAAGGGEQWPVELGERLPGWETLSGFHNSPWQMSDRAETLLSEMQAALREENAQQTLAMVETEIENLNELISVMQTIEGGFDLLPYIIDVRKILAWWMNVLEKNPPEIRGRELRKQIERINPEHPLAEITFAISESIE